VAGAIVAAEPQAEPEIDFSADAVVTGPAENYGGGDTASSGSRHGATSGAATEGASSSGEGQGDRHPSHARAVGLSDAGWTCPRPEDARDVPSEDETVVLTVVVHPDGRVLSAALVSDPGHGLGERALACARAQRFAPATDDAGRPILATSPQIRVRFTR
jgi:protein TonB